MIDVQQKLTETIAAIEAFTRAGVELPVEALELREIMQRCVDAESALDAVYDPDSVATAMQLDREAYEAYCRHTGWKSLATGADLPQWDALPDAIRIAWRVSAAWVIGQALRRFGLWK